MCRHKVSFEVLGLKSLIVSGLLEVCRKVCLLFGFKTTRVSCDRMWSSKVFCVLSFRQKRFLEDQVHDFKGIKQKGFWVLEVHLKLLHDTRFLWGSVLGLRKVSGFFAW